MISQKVIYEVTCTRCNNHDKAMRKSKEFMGPWVWAKDLADITVEGQKITLCHYAMHTWNKSHHGAWQLHGHSHGSLKPDPNMLRVDVGVDCWSYSPVSMAEIAKVMAEKTFKPVDRHGT